VKKSVHVVEESIYDRFYQVKVCTKRDADCDECSDLRHFAHRISSSYSNEHGNAWNGLDRLQFIS